jgi:DNA-binding NarL/FixJ family response regulator
MPSIFLVDDHKVVRDGLKAILELQSDIVYTGVASNGLQALSRIEALRPDIVVMDITMPEMNGLEATRRVLKSCPQTKVIILSMHSSMEHVIRAFEAGARGFLVKESAGAEVVEAVRTIQKGFRYLSPKIQDKIIKAYIDEYSSEETICPLDRLNAREREVLQLVAEGKSSKYIADKLSLSTTTVNTYRSRLMKKLHLKSTSELIKFAIQHDLTPLD